MPSSRGSSLPARGRSVGPAFGAKMTRKQSARRPAPSAAKWALLAEAGLPAAVVSASGRLQQTSASLRELLGYTAKELRTLRFADLTHPGVEPEGV